MHQFSDDIDGEHEGRIYVSGEYDEGVSGVSKHRPVEAEIFDAATLAEEHRAGWTRLLLSQPSLDAPCFDPDFVCGLAEHVPDCKVAVLHRGSVVVGYLAFTQLSRAVAGPIPMCDYLPFVSAHGAGLDGRDVARAIGVGSLHFENTIVPSGLIRSATTYTSARSPRIDASRGFEAYRTELQAAGRSVKNYQRKIRLLERDHGAVLLLPAADPSEALERLLRFKAGRYAPINGFPNWVGAALARFLTAPSSRIASTVWILRAGSAEVAYLLCLKRGRLLYYWFPTFDPAFRKYSPGMVALWLLIQELPAIACDKIDLGPGGETYKAYFANRHLEVASGHIHASALVAASRQLGRHAEQQLRSSAIVANYLKPAFRWLRGVR